MMASLTELIKTAVQCCHDREINGALVLELIFFDLPGTSQHAWRKILEGMKGYQKYNFGLMY